ncbi:hypothetical protein H072_10987 [Dactylellina haptotyla CBS 200.50]|uniref:Extracellular membrane protein CFEM domain-containing protein n=1 Tax=Dactylellina haptotyla (strain CBS 200.50) TaxID=1284197 RepID=S8B958_DACHA|nr:hypothetical protein H072_10987 [Dactylellina haptotyla CBS 200.50]
MLLPSWNSLLTTGSLVLGLALVIPQVAAQEPTAVVSLVFDSDWESALPCVQTCLFYNGGFGRGGDSPQIQDVGKAIGCGRYAKNNCFCAKALASSATSYISSFVTANCEPTQTGALAQALSLYGRYCSTANTGADALPQSTGASATDTGTFVPDQSDPAAADNGPAFSDTGLSGASKVALGVGLGLGLSVLIFLLSIFFCLWRRGRRGDQGTPTGGGSKK